MRLPWQQSDLHPHALSLIEPDMTGDFADALAADLAAFNPPDIIHRYRIVAPEGQGADILPKAGFTATRLTHLIDLPLDGLDAGPLPEQIAPHWFQPNERAPWDDWLTQHWRHYCATHRSNPPRDPAAGLKSIFATDDLIEGLALRDGPQGRVRAFASLRKDQELGWIGGAPDLMPHALTACLRRAIAIGWTKATLEVDDDDRPLWALAQTLGHPPTANFVTWHRERHPQRRPH